MKTIKKPLILFTAISSLALILFTTFFNLQAREPLPSFLAGEPVPGAEIYVELEPDDEPIFNDPTNEEGEVIFSVLISPPEIPNLPVIPVINVYVDLNYEIITDLNKILLEKSPVRKNSQPFGKYNFVLTTSVEKQKIEKKFVVDIKDNEALKSLSKSKSGPFKITLPKITPEQFKASRGKVKVPVTLNLTLASVNNYGINDDGIK
ncbi:hypothetical protein MASR2M69_06390 [Bacteroidota bacterium]